MLNENIAIFFLFFNLKINFSLIVWGVWLIEELLLYKEGQLILFNEKVFLSFSFVSKSSKPSKSSLFLLIIGDKNCFFWLIVLFVSFVRFDILGEPPTAFKFILLIIPLLLIFVFEFEWLKLL